MTLTDILTIIAIFLGPIAAIQIQKCLELKRERRNRRNNIFKTLMATRGSPVSVSHVESLNMIELEFDSNNKEDNSVIAKWREYLDHLADDPKDIKSPTYKADLNRWIEGNSVHLVNLLYEMGKSLEYSFDKVTLKKGVYVPRGHNELEADHYFLRKALIDIFLGSRPFPVVVKPEKKNINSSK